MNEGDLTINKFRENNELFLTLKKYIIVDESCWSCISLKEYKINLFYEYELKKV